MEHVMRFELTTFAMARRRSNPLSYTCKQEGDDTLTSRRFGSGYWLLLCSPFGSRGGNRTHRGQINSLLPPPWWAPWNEHVLKVSSLPWRVWNPPSGPPKDVKLEPRYTAVKEEARQGVPGFWSLEEGRIR